MFALNEKMVQISHIPKNSMSKIFDIGQKKIEQHNFYD
jgi:hypothetical protein